MASLNEIAEQGLAYFGAQAVNSANASYTHAANQAQIDLLNHQNAFNSAEASKQRDWEAYMSNTAYQRARHDMEAAGINPILLGANAQSASTPTGYAASSANSQSMHVPNVVNVLQNVANTGQNARKLDNGLIGSILKALF